MNTTRRRFLTQSATLAGMSAIAPGTLFAKPSKVGANDKIRVAGIGLGPRGRKDLKCFLDQPDVRFVAIADVQEERREIIRKTVNRHYGNEDCKSYIDMQEILERDDIDAVLIATGDRWHGTASIMAAQAGKDIYCEKPCTMSIEECQQLDEAVISNKRIYQGGMQRRNVDNFQFAAQLARSGKLGKLKELHAGIWLPVPVKPNLPGEPQPDASVCDWNAWVGPAPAKPYNLKYLRGGWRHYQGFSAGWGLHDWASHTLNMCQWAIDADDTVPVEYWFADNELRARYANGVELVMRLAGFEKEGDWLGLGSCPVRFVGDKGWVEAGDFSKIAYSDAALAGGHEPAEMFGIDPVKHIREFVDSIKSRKATACNSTVVRKTEVACHASAISWKLGRRLKFDPAKEAFIGDDEANALCSYQRRAPFTV
jgi:predicted dehydrogenase